MINYIKIFIWPQHGSLCYLIRCVSKLCKAIGEHWIIDKHFRRINAGLLDVDIVTSCNMMACGHPGKGILTCVPLRLLIKKFPQCCPNFSGCSQSGLCSANFMMTLLLPRVDLRANEVNLRNYFLACPWRARINLCASPHLFPGCANSSFYEVLM